MNEQVKKKIKKLLALSKSSNENEAMAALEKARKLATISLNETMRYLITETLDFLNYKGKAIDPLTQEAYQYYQNLKV